MSDIFHDQKSLKWAAALWAVLTFSGVQTLYFFVPSVLMKRELLAGIFAHLLHFAFLYLVCHFLHSFWLRRHEALIRRGLYLGALYFALAFVVLVFVWPGLWSWDDIVVLTGARVYHPTAWQHMFSGFFQQLALLTLPFPTGVLLIQIFLAAAVVGYAGAMLGEVTVKTERGRKWFGVGVVCLSLLPPLLMYILAGFRMGIYSFLELFLLVRIYVWYQQGWTINRKEMLGIAALILLVASWRTEAIFYPVLIFVPLALMQRTFSRRALSVSLAGVLIVTWGVGMVNSKLIKNNDDYTLLPTMVGSVELIHQVKAEQEPEAMAGLGRVLDLNVVRSHPELDGVGLYWEHRPILSHTAADKAAYYKSYGYLLRKYPGIVLTKLENIFWRASGMARDENGRTQQFTVTGNTLSLMNPETAVGEKWANIIGLGKTPWNESLRASVVHLIACEDADGRQTFLGLLLYNVWLPIGLALCCFVLCLVIRHFFEAGIFSLLLARVLTIFVSEPSPYLMYYLSIYLCAYVLAFTLFVRWLWRRKHHAAA